MGEWEEGARSLTHSVPLSANPAGQDNSQSRPCSAAVLSGARVGRWAAFRALLGLWGAGH